MGYAMALAVPFFWRHLCGSGPETWGPSAKAYYILGAAGAARVGIVGLIKAGRAESRLEVFDEVPRASHGLGVVALPSGVAANYSIAW